MNAKVFKLLRSYSRCSEIELTKVKQEWLSTPRSERGKVRTTMESGIWSNQLRDWQKQHGLLQKQAADKLNVPEDTYRGWMSMKRTPARHVRIALLTMMRLFVSDKASCASPGHRP